MESKIILLDTSILIDYFRKTNKENSFWISLVRQGYCFAVSAVTKYEIYAGATEAQLAFWNKIFQTITVLPFDDLVSEKAVEINQKFKKKRKQIDIADLFIAATATANELTIATLNKAHFERIDELIMVE